MILLLGYLGSLLVTFAVSVVVLTTFLGLVPQKATKHPRPIPIIQTGDQVKHQGKPTVTLVTGASKRQATVVSDGARFRDAAGEQTEGPRWKITHAQIKQRHYAFRRDEGDYPLALGYSSQPSDYQARW
jgi:hypothetical protein